MEVFETGRVEKELNKTLICLILKTNKPSSFKQFRSISLCNVTYKVITKLISNRLRPILPNLIRPTQTSFIVGRNIIDMS